MSLYTDDIDLLSTRRLLALPPMRWLLEPLIPEEGFALLYGAPGSCKSFVALDWAMCVSEGKSWLGRYPTRQNPVVFVAAEGGRGIQRRVRAWMAYHGYKDLTAMYWLLEPLYVRQEGAVENFLEHLEAEGIWPGLMVLDTLSRSFGGGEENASADMGAFVGRMTELAKGRRMASLVVHHENAAGTKERGHTALWGGLDTMFRCKSEKDIHNHVNRVEITNKKQKDDLELAPIYIAPIVTGELPSLVFELTTAPPEKERGSSESKPMRAIDMLTAIRIAEKGLTWQEWRISTNLSKSAFSGRLRRLIREGYVYKDTDCGRYFAVPDPKDLIATEMEKEK